MCANMIDSNFCAHDVYFFVIRVCVCDFAFIDPFEMNCFIIFEIIFEMNNKSNRGGNDQRQSLLVSLHSFLFFGWTICCCWVETIQKKISERVTER